MKSAPRQAEFGPSRRFRAPSDLLRFSRSVASLDRFSFLDSALAARLRLHQKLIAIGDASAVRFMARSLTDIRNLGVIAHIDAGKTTVTERMLHYAGMTHRPGGVDEGTTVTDFDPEEQQRGITIYGAAVSFPWLGKQFNLIDTPGHVDFTAEVERALRVLDGAVVVFSAREGVEAQSETVWRQADKYGVPRVAFVNKMDREGANFEAVLGQMKTRLHANPVVIVVPIGVGPPHVPDRFRGTIDLVTMEELTFDKADKGKTIHRKPVSDELLEYADEWRQKLLDELFNYSDDLAALLLEEQPVPVELVRETLRKATIDRAIQPVLCGSALDYIGVQPVLDAVSYYLPSPAERPPVAGHAPAAQGGKKGGKKKLDEETPLVEETRKPDPKEPFCGLVFKINAEKHGDLYFVRVYSGTLQANSRVVNPRVNDKENVSQLWRIFADRREQVPEVSAGDIIGVIGLRHSVTGDTICDVKSPIVLESITFPETVISMAIEPESSNERKKLAEVLEMLKRQDPTFRAQTNEDTGQTLISGMGELHLEIIKNRLLRDFNLKVKVHKPRVSYRETIARAAEVTGVCDRTVNGARLNAEVKIRLEPTDSADKGVAVESQLPETPLVDQLGDQLVESLTHKMQGGGMTGCPLMKMKLVVLDLKSTEEVVSEVALNIAAADAVDQALKQAGTVLLEPIMKVEVSVPDEFVGNVVSDLQQRRATIFGQSQAGPATVLDAHVPLKEMFGYSSDVRSLTQGRAGWSMEPHAYQAAPAAALEQFM